MTTKQLKSRATTTTCRPSADLVRRSNRFLDRWLENDPHILRAIAFDTGFSGCPDFIPHDMDDLQTMQQSSLCVGDNDHVTHVRRDSYLARLRRLNALANSLAMLDQLSTEFGIKAVDIRNLVPFNGNPDSADIANHVQLVLDRIEMTEDMYASARIWGASPRRSDIVHYRRFMDEERAKLLREIHLVGCKLAELNDDPEFGNIPSVPTEPAFLDGVDFDLLREFLSEPSGHSFWADTAFIRLGFDPAVVASLSRHHESSSRDPMQTITDMNGNVVESLDSVYELEFLWILAREVGADVREAATKYGRGTQARLLAAAILTVVDTTAPTAA